MSTKVITPFHGNHDHNLCLAQAIENAIRICEVQGLRFTPLRRNTLELIWRSHKPMGAYDVLEGLKALGHKPAPPTAYRALEFLHDAGLIHRIESLNAYVGCADPKAAHVGQFLICEHCASVAEIHDTNLAKKITAMAKSLGFSPKSQMIEVKGLCPDCQASA